MGSSAGFSLACAAGAWCMKFWLIRLNRKIRQTNVPYIVHAEPTSVVDDLCDTLQTDVIRVAVDGNQAGHSCILFIVMVVRLFGRSSRTRLFMYESPKSK